MRSDCSSLGSGTICGVAVGEGVGDCVEPCDPELPVLLPVVPPLSGLPKFPIALVGLADGDGLGVPAEVMVTLAVTVADLVALVVVVPFEVVPPVPVVVTLAGAGF